MFICDFHTNGLRKMLCACFECNKTYVIWFKNCLLSIKQNCRNYLWFYYSTHFSLSAEYGDCSRELIEPPDYTNFSANDYDGIRRNAKIHHGTHPQQLADGTVMFLEDQSFIRKIVNGEVFTTIGERHHQIHLYT